MNPTGFAAPPAPPLLDCAGHFPRGYNTVNRTSDSLGGPEGYLRYLYIQNLEDSKGQIIYVPTEGGLPILEAGQRGTSHN